MIEVNKQEAKHLSKTHDFFYEQHIEARTDKAYKVRMQNRKGNLCVFWVPRSKLKFVVVPDAREYLNNGQGSFFPNPDYNKPRRKYLTPLYFTDPSIRLRKSKK